MRHLKGHLKSIIVSWERQLGTVWTTSGSKQLSSAWWFRRKAILVRLPVKRSVIIAMSDCVGTDTRNPAEILMTFSTSNWYSGSTLVYSWLLNLFFFTTQVSSSTSCRCCGSTSLAAWLSGSKVVWCCYQDIWQPVWQPDRGISNPPHLQTPHLQLSFFWGHSPSLTSQWCEMRLHPFAHSWPMRRQQALCKWWGDEKIFMSQNIAGDRCHLSPEPQVYVPIALWV